MHLEVCWHLRKCVRPGSERSKIEVEESLSAFHNGEILSFGSCIWSKTTNKNNNIHISDSDVF